MNHEEFRQAAGADPHHVTSEMTQHMAGCADCARYHADMLALDVRLLAAMRIPVPEAPQAPGAPDAPGTGETGHPARHRSLLLPVGLAAAAAMLTFAAATLFLGSPGNALAHAVAMHAAGEPRSFAAEGPVAAQDLQRVLATSGLSLLPGAPTVTYARTCPLRGHAVAHLVVQSAHGPVVVLVMTHEPVREREAFSDGGFRGLLVPTKKGSLAVLSADQHDVDEVVGAVESRIRYVE